MSQKKRANSEGNMKSLERTQWRPIWDLNQPGTQLEALESLRLDYADSGETLFTAGKRYAVVRVHPLGNPPVAIVLDDTGGENHIDASFLPHFRLVRDSC